MLPLPVFLIKLFGWVQGVAFVVISNRQAGKLHSPDVTSSSIGSPGLLLAYRLSGLAWGLFIGLKQIADKGRYVFIFFTVWNWWLLTLFFALASAASLRAWLRRRRGQQRLEQQHAADWLDRAVMATFTIETPEVQMVFVIDAMTWLVLVPMLVASEQDPKRRTYWLAAHHNFESYNMTVTIDTLTWLVLVPMLMDSSDVAHKQFWHQRLYSFESYNQHGFNAVMMLGELLLNRIPVTFYASGWLALWTSLFGVWSALFYAKTGRFIYPFLDAHKPYAWVSYVGLYAVHWLAHFVVMGLTRTKARLLSNKTVALEPASSSVLSSRLKTG